MQVPFQPPRDDDGRPHYEAAPPFRLPSQGPFRGHCLYKTGKCKNERALKTNGQAHNLCDLHRLKQNQNQRKMDSKMRCKKDCDDGSVSSPPYARVNHTTAFDQGRHHDQYRQSHYHPQHLHNLHPQVPLPTPPPTFLPRQRSHEAPPPQYWKTHDNDTITVPTPSFLKGEAREAFRSRVLQRLLNIISEEVTAVPYEPKPEPPSTHEQSPHHYNYTRTPSSPPPRYPPHHAYAYRSPDATKSTPPTAPATTTTTTLPPLSVFQTSNHPSEF
ncbi:Aste57867_21520 [Aphanomyces stellatus]|uniref:Aste57867_21520 protein n=1 Tax=Aphanomyces stellatus TaxID=120398 RepID=A0A485LHP9_9STRA|nr:hypothetical protein As57867_021451 [Aphanomyces stellatus]VFT98190.1 Aste57867_21520 [Aphanomyces stellatus]